MKKRRALHSNSHQTEVEKHAGHDHNVSAEVDQRQLMIALSLIVTYMAVEVVMAFFAHSLALLADAGHMLTDAGALGASLWAARLAARPATGKWTYGFKRAEILSAATNGATLLVVAAIIAVESVSHLIHPALVNGGVVVATVIAGVVILTTGFKRADAIASLVVVALMLKAAWGLLKGSGRILLEAAPENVDLDDVRLHLLGVAHVRDVHDLHAWTVTSNLPALSSHVVIDDSCFTDGCVPRILDELQACLVGHFDVEHSTLQVEPARHLDHEAGAH